MVRKSELFFWNSDPILGYAIPLTPNIIPMGGGGVTARAGLPLPRDLEVCMDQSKEGVVVVSFRSVISALPDNVLAKFAEAFSSLKENVVWRFKHVSRFEVPANVRLVKWLPQNDLLAHPNTKLFVTHCGNNGQYEAFYHGIPMLATPLVWDLPHNAVRINSKGFGLTLNINSFSVDEMSSKMKELLYNPKYTKAIKIASRRFRSMPQTPREKASFWIEYVIKHGDCSHLHSHALTMPWYQLIMFDIGATVFLSVSLLTTVLLAFLYICVIRMRRVKEKTLWKLRSNIFNLSMICNLIADKTMQFYNRTCYDITFVKLFAFYTQTNNFCIKFIVPTLCFIYDHVLKRCFTNWQLKLT